MKDRIRNIIQTSIDAKLALQQNEDLLAGIESAVQTIVKCFLNDGKLLLCGNGGSAADAQHIAAELSGRFYIDRRPLFAEALHVNTSYLTSVANDYGYDEVFARMVGAMGRPGDVLIGLSTSGGSKNVVMAINAANKLGMTTIGMTGETGGLLAPLVDILLNVPSKDTPRIQESHSLIGHIICELTEAKLFK